MVLEPGKRDPFGEDLKETVAFSEKTSPEATQQEGPQRNELINTLISIVPSVAFFACLFFVCFLRASKEPNLIVGRVKGAQCYSPYR